MPTDSDLKIVSGQETRSGPDTALSASPSVNVAGEASAHASGLAEPLAMNSAAQIVISIVAVLALFYVGKLVLVTLSTAILLAFVLAPIVEFLERLSLPRALAAFLAVLLVLALIYGLIYFSYNRALDFVHDFPKYSGKIREHLLKFRQQAQKIQQTTETVLPPTADEKKAVKVEQQQNWSETLTSTVGSVTEVVFLMSFIPFLTYFMLTWQGHMRSATVMLFPMKSRNTAYVAIGQISAMMRSFIVGNFVIGLFTAILSIIVFGVLKLPYFYFLGFVSGFLSIIPYLGVVLALLPPVVTGFGTLSSTGFIIIISTVLGLHLFAINVLYPKVIGKRLQLNPLVVTISLLGWGWLWGAMGLILAVPITGAMKIIFDHIDALRPWGAWMGE